MREASTVIEGKWLGSCNPGQKPGDVSIPGMPNMNLKDMMKRPAQETLNLGDAKQRVSPR